MILRYLRHDGTQMEFELGERPITLGRSPDADIVILDEKASRLHCGIRLWDGDFYIKDLKSKNGTYVNGVRIEMTKLNPGDQIRIGSSLITFDSDPAKGERTILREVAEELAQGKGYNTLLREIVEEVPPPSAPVPARPAAPHAADVSEMRATQPVKPTPHDKPAPPAKPKPVIKAPHPPKAPPKLRVRLPKKP